MCLCNTNRDVKSLHILQYKDVGVPSEPLTRQSNTARMQGSNNRFTADNENSVLNGSWREGKFRLKYATNLSR